MYESIAEKPNYEKVGAFKTVGGTPYISARNKRNVISFDWGSSGQIHIYIDSTLVKTI